MTRLKCVSNENPEVIFNRKMTKINWRELHNVSTTSKCSVALPNGYATFLLSKNTLLMIKSCIDAAALSVRYLIFA